MKDVHSRLADAVSNNPLPITVKSKTSKEQRKFVILQPSFGILIHTSSILSEMSLESVESLFESRNVFSFVKEHGKRILQVIAIVLDNDINYTKSTFDFLHDNLTAYEIYDLLVNITLRIGIQDFQKSIIAVTPMSLLNQTEIIALIRKSLTPLSS
jgi:hypothetical protein